MVRIHGLVSAASARDPPAAAFGPAGDGAGSRPPLRVTAAGTRRRRCDMGGADDPRMARKAAPGGDILGFGSRTMWHGLFAEGFVVQQRPR